MNQHFTETEFNFCLSSGTNHLNTERQLHLSSCAQCRANLSEQTEADRILKELKPHRLSKDLSDLIINKIRRTRIKSIRLNGLIAASLIVTAILVSIQVFTAQPERTQSVSVLERLSEKITQLKPDHLKLPQIMPEESLPFNLESLVEFINTPFVALFFFVGFVLSAYLLADQYYHKTMIRKH